MTYRKLALISIFVLSASSGVLQLLGVSTALQKLLVVALLFLANLYYGFIDAIVYRRLHVFLAAMLIVSIVLSANIHGYSLPSLVGFSQILFSVFCLLATYSLAKKEMTDDSLLRIIHVFCFVQFIAAIIKLVTIGQSEGGGIGTISRQAGSMSLFIVMTFFTLGTFYIKQNLQKSMLFFSLGVCFGLINEKRAWVFLLPIVLLYASGFSLSGFLKNAIPRSLSFSKKNLLISVACICFVIGGTTLGAKLMPTVTGGKFGDNSLSGIPARIWLYLTWTNPDGTPRGRISALVADFEYSSQRGCLLFGCGGDRHLESSLTEDKEMKYPVIGTLKVISRFGILGVIIFLSIYASIIASVAKDNRWKIVFIGYIAFDFTLYSSSFFTGTVIPVFLGIFMASRPAQSWGSKKVTI